MTEIQNPKQKKTIVLNRFGICNLEFEACPFLPCVAAGPCNGRRVYL
jgi:hypothetical protein